MAEEQVVDELGELKSIAQQILDHLTGSQGDKGKKDKEETDKKAVRAQQQLTAMVDRTADAFLDLGKQVFTIVAAGAKLANSLGQTVTQGIRQEFRNRNVIAGQIFTADKDRIVSMQQLISAEQAMADTFVGVREGMEISASGVAAFNQSLKGGFKSDFKLTGDSMRALVTAGVATEKEFSNLRKASGRASLSNEQLANLVNKNSLSFMLYGPKFAKAAAQAEKLGINLAQVQSAQESMVTNLDGTLDTLNQVNQLGAQIDFGTLMRINEFEGPEATLKYLQQTIPPSLFQSASTRALLKGFGVSVEDLMKRQGSAQDRAAKTMEDAMTKLAEPVGAISSILSELYQRGKALMDSYGPQIKAALGFGVAMFILVRTVGLVSGTFLMLKSAMFGLLGLRDILKGGFNKETLSKVLGNKGGAGAGAGTTGGAGGGLLSGMGTGLKGLAEGMRAFGDMRVILGLAAVTAAVIGLAYALKVAAPGIVAIGQAIKSTLEGVASIVVAIGTAIGSVVTAAGTAISGLFKTLSTMSPMQLAGIALSMVSLGAALAGFGVTGLLAIPALIGVTNRMKALSQTASGVQILSNSFKDLVATIEKLKDVDLSKLKELNTTVPKLSTVGATTTTITNAKLAAAKPGERPATESTELTRKIDELIRVLRDTKTVITIDNKVQQLPRTALAGVTLRNDRI